MGRNRKTEGWSVFERATGAWVLSYQAEPGEWRQRHLGQLSNRPEAERAALAWMAQCKADGSLPAATGKIADLADRWLRIRSASPNLAGSTVTDNKSHLSVYIVPKFGKLPLGQLSTKHLRPWIRELRDKIAPSTLRNIINTFSAFYEDARAEGWIKAPANVLRDPGVRKEMPEVKRRIDAMITLSLETAQRLLSDLRLPILRRVRYAIGFLAGLRDGEIAGLQWGDVGFDDETPTLRVRRAHAFKAEPGQHAGITDPKTDGSIRDVAMHPALVAALREWLRDAWPTWAQAPYSLSAPVFPSPRTGGHWRPRSAEELRADLLTLSLPDSLGEAPIDFHATRRSLVTWLAQRGVEESLRGRILGHAGGSVTDRHYTGELLKRMGDAIALVPLTWGQLDPVAPSDTVAARNDDPTCISADLVHTHNESPKTTAAPVAQWTEQRFPNSSSSAPEVAGVASEDTGSGGGGAQDIGAQAELDRLTRRGRALLAPPKPRDQHFEERWRQLSDEAALRLRTGVDLAIDGRTELSPSEREQALLVALSEATALLTKRDEMRG